MKFSMHVVRSFRPTVAAALTLFIPGIIAPSILFAIPGRAFAQEEDSPKLESAATSKLTGIKFPSGGFRPTQADMVSQFDGPLGKMAAAAKGHIGKSEIVIWPKDAGARSKMATSLKGAGYQYSPQDAIKTEEGANEVTPFVITRKDSKGAPMVGFWVESDKMSLLAWGTVVGGRASSDGDTPEANEKPSAGGTDEGNTPQPPATEEAPADSGSPSSQWEAAPQSRIAPIKMPSKANRSLNSGFNDKLAAKIRQVVEDAGYSVTPVEVLVWEGDAASDMAGNRNAVVSNLRKAGYEIQTKAPVKTEQGNLYFFVATNSKTKAGYIGYFMEGPIQMLVWGKLVKSAPAN